MIVAILVIAALSLCAEAQEPSHVKADAQKFVKMITATRPRARFIAMSLSSVSRSRRLIREIKRRPMSCISKWTN